MKKVFFDLKAVTKFQLVKGCPTDINGDGHDNDDYNHDGNIDQNDYDYYDGYMDGYGSDDDYDPSQHSDAHNIGHSNGADDQQNDIISFDNNGPDILSQDFVGGYY